MTAQQQLLVLSRQLRDLSERLAGAAALVGNGEHAAAFDEAHAVQMALLSQRMRIEMGHLFGLIDDEAGAQQLRDIEDARPRRKR